MPKHWGLKEWLTEFAQVNPAGTLVPPERQLAQQFEMSRTTVRRALQEMVVEGRLARVQGKGTFVAQSKVHHRLRLSSYTEEISAQGMSASSKLLASEVIPASPSIAERLRIDPERKVLRIERLRYANLEPMAVDIAYFSVDRFPDLESRLDRYGSIYTALRDLYGVQPARAEQTIETAMASPGEAKLLNAENGLPLLLLTRHAFLENDEPVEWARSVFRGDRYKFVATLRREE